MPKATFDDFIKQNPNYSNVFSNNEFQEVFDRILSTDNNISAMIHASDIGVPALDACMVEIDLLLGNILEDRDDKKQVLFLKQGIGKLVKTVIEPFGYVPDSRKTMMNHTHIKSATVYAKKISPTMKVNIEIAEIYPS